ncbi:MAG TPA: class F sortase [Pseudonocardiaceae bacterium]
MTAVFLARMRRGARVAAAALVVGAALLTGGCGLDSVLAGSAAPEVAAAPVAPLARSVPAEVIVPGIGAASSLVELGLNPDETVQVPPVDNPMQAGWYALGATPGEAGPAVILGHVDGGGRPGIFHRLHEVEAGEEVLVRRADGVTAVFTVTRVAQVPKSEFPTEEVYGGSGAPELRIITCGGEFDRERQSYRDNVIVYASLTATRA